jgi:hypothetical protein
MLLVASRTDIAGDGRRLRAIERLAVHQGIEFFAISSATGEGIGELKFAVARRLRELAPPAVAEAIAKGSEEVKG